MALEYKSNIGLDVIMPVLDEYVVWYGKIVKAYFEGKPFTGAAPTVFGQWIDKAGLPANVEEKARRIHEGMIGAAQSFINKYAARDNPPLGEYNEFSKHYEEFIQFMRRLELDQANENSGFDDRTGLRSAKLMKDDIAREMDRRARRGNPFSLALIKINGYNPAWEKDEGAHRAMIRKISDQIKHCLRSFDDAYYMGAEYFLLSLKHADRIGSQAAVSRLNIAIAGAHIESPDGRGPEISLSAVLLEPAPGDALDEIIRNMKSDLAGIEAKGAVLQYNDLSPLQRYIHSIDQGK